MKRRNFVGTSAAAMLAGAAEPESPKNQIFHLVYFYLRTGPQVERTTQYLSNVFLPAVQRAGAGPVGLFNTVIGDRSPCILSLACYPSLASVETTQVRLAEDKEFSKGWDAYNNIAEPSYVRLESVLLRAFDGIPKLEAPPLEARRTARTFELRTYESVNEKASRRKIKMFEEGEAGIFRRLGMLPVFFGQAITGRNLPSLTYMLAFDDLDARERLWRSFSTDPEWQKLRSKPGLSDAEIVSNITSTFLRPLSASMIR